jgi:hypothetical protein
MSDLATHPPSPENSNSQHQDAQRVLDAARRFIACRELATALAAGHLPPPKSLSEAIERDFVGFDLSRAERDLREAVIAAEPHLAIPAPRLAFSHRSTQRRRERSQRGAVATEFMDA